MENKIVTNIKKEFIDNTDLVIKKVNITKFKDIYVIYLESVTGSDKVNEYVLKNITLLNALKRVSLNKLQSTIPAPHTVILKNEDDIEFYITNGFTIIIRNNEILAVETKADINRGIPEPTTQQAVFGPKDAFTENIQINLGLVKRRIKSHTLKVKSKVLGRKTLTMTNILYFEDIADDELIQSVLNELDKIDIDGILDSGELALFLESNNKSHFPTVLKTERPDHTCNALLEGKIVILVDTSPFALINYNPETIPTSLLINFSRQRASVPFPSIIEAIIMLFIYEILRESDIRFPNSYGSAISILGALILGEAAVNAGFVSPIMIIVVAFTFITSLLFTEQELVQAARHFRIIFLFLAAIYGLYGIVLAFIYFIIHITNIKTFSMPYFYPLSPFKKDYLFKGLLKKNITKDTKRSKLLASKNITRERRFNS